MGRRRIHTTAYVGDVDVTLELEDLAQVVSELSDHGLVCLATIGDAETHGLTSPWLGQHIAACRGVA